METIKIKLEGGLPPKKEFEQSAGYDLTLNRDVKIRKGRQVVKLGFKIEVPEGVGMFIMSRSGVKAKGVEGYTILGDKEAKRHDCDVELGLVDCGYRGEVGILVHNHDQEFWIEKGTAIAQAVFVETKSYQIEEVESLSESERGEQGFNS